jgi:hypothetical protein
LGTQQGGNVSAVTAMSVEARTFSPHIMFVAVKGYLIGKNKIHGIVYWKFVKKNNNNKYIGVFA